MFSLPLYANSVEVHRLTPIIVLGFDGGGENISHLTNESDFDLAAGSGFVFGIGAVFDLTQTRPHAFELQLTANYKFNWNSDEDKGEVTWDQAFFELMHFYRNQFQQFRFGYGVTQHFFTDLEGDQRRPQADTEVNKPVGFVMAAEIYFPGGGTFGLRYRNITFEGNSGKTARGDGLGFYAIVDFSYLQ